MTDSYTAHLENLREDLMVLVERGHSPEAASALLRRQQETMFRGHQELLELRIAALAQAEGELIDRQNSVRYLQKQAVRFGRESWYLGPAARESLWEKQAVQLRGDGRSDDEVSGLDRESTTVVSLVDNPIKPDFSTRGLVVGHVQSGKTANMAAVIAKAADTPYKFFLVLSGLTDQLRNQTQMRLERDVVALERERWMCWTAEDTVDRKGDFADSAIGGFSFDQRNQLAVIKKNAGVLRRFLAKLKNTDTATLKNTPFLIIDDECDQASVNSAKLRNAVTRINELIRKILKELPRAAYVGYTATPFANVLVDPSVPEDLYPRDFIHALEQPAAYFGAEALFGRHALDGEYREESEGVDMIRIIPDVEIPMLRPAPGHENALVVPPSLERAIRYFLMVVAARRFRGRADTHNTMLLHTSVLNSMHRRTERVVRPFVEQMAAQLTAGEPSLLALCEAEWTAEQDRVLSEQFDRQPVSFADLHSHLAAVAASVRVHVENWTATERLDYTGQPQTVIVIGGNVLARGLTLEGLSVSYFLRSSSQYDTLMQMGRWFGYRRGYEDLPRIWVEEKVREAFFDLATVEAEIRRDIVRYAEEEITPKEFAVRIRKIPGMAITAANKMRAAVPTSIGFQGEHVQTTRFRRRDVQWLADNWAAGSRLIDRIHGRYGHGPLYRSVPMAEITGFLRDYRVHETHRALQPEFLVRFIESGAVVDPRMAAWSVVVIGGGGGPSARPLGALGAVGTVIRSAERDSGADASIKALMSRGDVLTDLDAAPEAGSTWQWAALKELRERRGAPAMLLLYPIQAESAPRRSAGGSSREPLGAVSDVLGIGIVFPGDSRLSGTYVSVQLEPDFVEVAEAVDDAVEGDRLPEQLLDVSAGAAP